jgi:predicted MPP superfamily phosphohydrolase
MQAILLLAHWFIFHTLVVFWADLSPVGSLALRGTLFVLAFSFIFAALLSFRFTNLPVTLVYRFAAVWLGFLNFFFCAACLCWLCRLALWSFQMPASPAQSRMLALVLFATAFLAGIYGLLNAFWIRIRRVPVQLPNLPACWRGRTALLISDLHLGNVNGLFFSRRVAAMAAELRPDIVFVPGDLFDGSRIDPDSLISPFEALCPPLGIYYATGNHDEYGDLDHYLAALNRGGIQVLFNERVCVEGLDLIGVAYGDSGYLALQSFLKSLHLDASQPSILLNHVPHRLPIVEQAGVSLQLSGHTHGGQVFPFTWLTRRAFGKFTYGLQRFGALQVFTSSGAGTWGPPMRVGTHAEMVLLQFE